MKKEDIRIILSGAIGLSIGSAVKFDWDMGYFLGIYGFCVFIEIQFSRLEKP